MVEHAVKYEKILLLTLNVICKIAGIVIFYFYIKEQFTILLPLAAVTFFIPVFGCFGAMFESKNLLQTYAGLQVAFLFCQVVLLMYCIFGKHHYDRHKLTRLEKDYQNIPIHQWIFLFITAIIEIATIILSLRLSRRLGRFNNAYENLINEEQTLQGDEEIVDRTVHI